jgi:phage-related baseplate assembly protein
MSNTVNLIQLPPPEVIETLSFETIRDAIIADAIARDEDGSLANLAPNDPGYKIIEACAYREVILRARINDAARSVLVAHARDGNLDNLGALNNVERKILDPGDETATPPIPPTYENNDSFRVRIPMAFEGLSVAGPEGAYIFHALQVAGTRDASVDSPTPGVVVVTILGATGDGTPNQTVLDAVEAALNAENIRPLTDQVIVAAADIVEFTVEAAVFVYPGLDGEMIRQSSETAVLAYVARQHRLGMDITPSGLFAALHREGVQRVELTTPAAGITTTKAQAAYCTGVTITLGGYDQ